MKRSILSVLAICLALSSCVSGGITSHFPRGGDTAGRAQVVILRPDGVWGAALRFQVSLDGYEIAILGPGEYISFTIPNGRHFLGEITASGFSFEFESEKTYYFLTKIHTELFGGTFYLSPSDRRQLEKYLKTSRDVSTIPYGK